MATHVVMYGMSTLMFILYIRIGGLSFKILEGPFF